MASRTLRALAWIAGRIPTLLVLAALAGLAYWGGQNDWKLPHWEWLFPAEEKEKEKEKEPDDGTSPRAIELASEDAAALAGIDVGSSKSDSLLQQVEAPAVLAFDQTRYAQLAPRAAGTAWRVFKGSGDEVRKGEVLALISAPEAGKVRGDFLNAYVQHEIRARTLEQATEAGTALPEQQLRQLRLALREARIRLLNEQQYLSNLGLSISLDELRGHSDDQVARKVRLLGLPASLHQESHLPANLLPLVSPLDGVVVRREVVSGEMTDPARPIFTVADPGRIWLQMHVRQEDAMRLLPGQKVTFLSRAADPGATDPPPAGRLTWVSPEVDPKTRTIAARAELTNRNGQLRPGAFGRALIDLQTLNAVVTVPAGALQWDGKGYRVFVREGPKTFEPRLVLPGLRQNGRTQLLDPRPIGAAGLVGNLTLGPWQGLAAWRAGSAILVPLRPGDPVATAGSHVLKSEMLKSRIGGED